MEVHSPSSSQLTLYITFLFSILIYLLTATIRRRCLHSQPTPHSTVHKYTLATDCRTIIQAVNLPTGPRNLLTLYKSRALECRTQSLKRIFGIRNAFTSRDERVVESFVDGVHGKLRLSNLDWFELARVLRGCFWEVADESAVDHVGDVRIRIIPLIQALSLRLILWIFFDMRNAKAVSATSLLRLSSAIHRTTKDMQSDNGRTVPDFRDNKALHAALAAVFPGQHHNILNPARNPLNWILPGFENIWRASLSSFVETMTTGKDGHGHGHAYGEILVAFARKPTNAMFEQMYTLPRNHEDEDEPSISAEYIILESLRLHPPTTQIHRAFHFAQPTLVSIPTTSSSSSSSSSETSKTKQTLTLLTATAEIATCHLSTEIWGLDAERFIPARWRKLSPAQGLSFLAFGSRPALCPAAQAGVGGRVVGLLVGVWGGEMGGGWVLEGKDKDRDSDRVGSGSGYKYENGHERMWEYEGLEIVRRVE